MAQASDGLLGNYQLLTSEGAYVKLECNVTGRPRPRREWWRDGEVCIRAAHRVTFFLISVFGCNMGFVTAI